VAKAHSHYVCQQCGADYARWQGRCEACGGWNSVIEEPLEATPRGLGAASKSSAKSKGLELARLDGSAERQARRATGIGEFDRVTGGGLVAASAVLVGGDPGIGKSTILLQAVARLAAQTRCAYVSGEESVDQVRMRAQRMGLAEAPVELAAATSVRDIVAVLDRAGGPELVVIDSIQTMYVDTLDSAPGTVAQVRASAQELIRVAKRRGTIVIMVGHVTKEGQIAGPRVLEHMVDTVLYFEGERGHQFRILRAVKNRFGPTDEIGVFEMTDRGLMEVQNPSSLFLTDRERPVSGAAVFAGIEGTRPMLVEVQALVSPSSFATPRRAVVGWDSGRLAMVLAVLEARCGLALGARDVYLNVAGGLRINEPAADLAVAAALMSSMADRPVPAGAVVFGEIGLSGEVRPVNQMDLRLKEAARLGFDHAIVPPRPRTKGKPAAGVADRLASGLRLTEIGWLHELGALFDGAAGGSGAGLRGLSRG
jgi:DNA repair protein RadA/Sms